MDKRSLIAIAVTFLVLILWQTLYLGPKQEKRLAERKQRIEYARQDSLSRANEEAAVKEETGSYGEEASLKISKSEEAEETAEINNRLIAAKDTAKSFKIEILTEVMNVTLRSRGGEIESVTLLNYKTHKGEPVKLIPEGEKGGVSVELKRGEITEGFDNANFSVTANGMRLDTDRRIMMGEEQEEVSIVFRKETIQGDYLEKRFVFFRDSYEYKTSFVMSREGDFKRADRYSIAWNCGMAVTEEDENMDRQGFASMGKVGGEFYKTPLRKFDDGKAKEQTGQVVWAGVRTKYFISALVEDNPSSATLEMRGNKEESMTGYAIVYPVRGDPDRVAHSYRGYIGPLDINGLEEFGVGLEKSIDFGWMRFLGVLALKVMLFFRKFIPNYGWIIILMSVITKVLFYRLTHKSFKSMKDMQKLQPKIKELQEKYKDDKEKLNKQTMKLYKEAGVNPLGGCLPMLLQMPVFIALFGALRNTIELRNAPFVLWINDLSSPDVLFDFGFSIPFLGSSFHLLPILMGAAMVLQSKLGASPTGGTAPPGQTKMMTTMMPVIFTFMFYRMPSGLVLYWIVNNLLTIIQQYFVHKQSEKEEGLANSANAV